MTDKHEAGPEKLVNNMSSSAMEIQQALDGTHQRQGQDFFYGWSFVNSGGSGKLFKDFENILLITDRLSV